MKTTIFDINERNLLELSENDTEFAAIKEAYASSIGTNETLSWAKFVLTDDQPNGNKVRIPQEEFSNIIRSGVYMPFKMAYKKPKEGHEESFPLGVLAHLKQSGNQIIALAALWRRERKEDIDFLKTQIAEKLPVNVSWEILHEDSKIGDDGIEDLIGTSLRGVTIVGRPAYQGRTPVLQVASLDGSTSNSEVNTLDELEQLKARVSELEAAIAAKDGELANKDNQIAEKETELAGLREFKASIEKKEAEAAKYADVKKLFSEAGITKPESYFEDNKERFLTMSKEDLEFMVQEMAAFSAQKADTKEDKSSEIPDLNGKTVDELDIKALAELLRKETK